MPKFLERMLAIEVFVFLLSLFLLSIYEQGFDKITMPLLALLPIALCIAFRLRLKFSDFALKMHCLAGATIGIAFVATNFLIPPSEPLQPQQWILVGDSVTGLLLYIALRGRRASHWFKFGRAN